MKEQKTIQKNKLNPDNIFYPRIIREFNDGPDEEPLVYGGM